MNKCCCKYISYIMCYQKTKNLPWMSSDSEAGNKAANQSSRNWVKHQTPAMMRIKICKSAAGRAERVNVDGRERKFLWANVMWIRRGNRKSRSNLLDAPSADNSHTSRTSTEARSKQLLIHNIHDTLYTSNNSFVNNPNKLRISRKLLRLDDRKYQLKESF